MQGKLITFEGIDNSGKSTQAKRLAAYLKRRGHEVLLVREPGGTKISEKIRKILLSAKNDKMSAQTELLLYEAARAQLVEEVILPALRRGMTVICDRFFDSTTAYQAYARGLDLNLVQRLNRLAAGGSIPNLTIVIDLPPQVALKRIKNNRKKPDRLEKEKLRFHKRVRHGYLAIAKKQPARVKVIDGQKEIKKVWKKVKLVADKFLKKDEV